jgi:hypothetical protein
MSVRHNALSELEKPESLAPLARVRVVPAGSGVPRRIDRRVPGPSGGIVLKYGPARDMRRITLLEYYLFGDLLIRTLCYALC